MISKNKVLQNLRCLRKIRQLRQEDVAPKLGIHRTTYVKKENGLVPITTDEWLRLAEILEVEPSLFFVTSSSAKQ